MAGSAATSGDSAANGAPAAVMSLRQRRMWLLHNGPAVR
jgi:hypothetical protein